MTITVKNLKIAQFASEETLCFEASVYVDGKRAFVAHYDGDRAKILAAIEDLDAEISKAIQAVEDAKEVKKILKKLAIFDKPNIFTWKCKPDNEQGRAVIAKKYPNAVILNDTPLEEAITIYKTI